MALQPTGAAKPAGNGVRVRPALAGVSSVGGGGDCVLVGVRVGVALVLLVPVRLPEEDAVGVPLCVGVTGGVAEREGLEPGEVEGEVNGQVTATTLPPPADPAAALAPPPAYVVAPTEALSREVTKELPPPPPAG